MINSPDREWIAERSALHRQFLRRWALVLLGFVAIDVAVTFLLSWLRS